LSNWTETEEPEKEGNKLFPVFLKLEDLRLLIIGGGKIAFEKLQAVLSNAPATHSYRGGS